MNLPRGTVHFLFTDIEGSTRLWENYPGVMRSALERHDTLATEIIGRHKGVLVKSRGEGDSLFVVFTRATDAVAAALAFQQALLLETWPSETPLGVRVAIHTGEVDLREGDYYGPAVNRCARLRAIAHGGQVLLSDATQELVRDALPAACALANLGEHRLRDLSRPETVFQLLHPTLPSAFPPLKSLDNPALPNNLPRQLSSFIGREKAIAQVKTLLNKTSLLTLTGSGGCGKTRFSLQVAAHVLEDYPDGAWFVELAPLSDPTFVAHTVAQVLGIKEQAGQTLQQSLTERLHSKRLLLVLDNCEHLLATCALLTAALLLSCPHIKVLATSRQALGIAGEQTFRVPSLSLPDPKQTLTLEILSQVEAVHLFLDRAMLVKSDFALSNQNALAVAQLCHRLDGIPLAVELAAARVRGMAVEQIEARLQDRFHLLTGGSRTALPRHQTLRALIDWSHDLLSEPERLLLRRLAVFMGGWTLEASEAICAGEGVEDWQVLDLLMGLVDKSLVVYEDAVQEKSRYRLLETVRQYATDRLVESGEGHTYRSRHRDYFLALAEEAAAQLRGWEQVRWLERLEREHDNLRAALDFCQAEPEGAEAGLRLAGALWEFWWTRGHWSEGRIRLAALLARPEAQEHILARANALDGAACLANAQRDRTTVRSLFEESLAIRRERGDKQGIAQSLHALGVVASEQGDQSAARSLLEESLALRRELGLKQGIAHSLSKLGCVAQIQGDYVISRALQEESLTLRRELGDKAGIAASLLNLANLAFSQGDESAARTHYEQCLVLWRELGDKEGVAYTLGPLGELADNRGDESAARSFWEEVLVLWRELGNKAGLAYTLRDLARLLAQQGEFSTAQAYLRECLTLCRERGDRWLTPSALEVSAGLAMEQRQPARAVRLLGAAQALREAIGSPLSPDEQEKYDHNRRELESLLGKDTYTAAFANAQALSFEQAIEYALG